MDVTKPYEFIGFGAIGQTFREAAPWTGTFCVHRARAGGIGPYGRMGVQGPVI